MQVEPPPPLQLVPSWLPPKQVAGQFASAVQGAPGSAPPPHCPSQSDALAQERPSRAPPAQRFTRPWKPSDATVSDAQSLLIASDNFVAAPAILLLALLSGHEGVLTGSLALASSHFPDAFCTAISYLAAALEIVAMHFAVSARAGEPPSANALIAASAMRRV